MFRELYYWAYMIISKHKRNKGYEDFYTSWVINGLLALNYMILLIIIDYLCIITWHFSFLHSLIRGKSFKDFLLAIILISPVLLYTHLKLFSKKKEIMQQYKNKKMSQFRQDWGKLFFWLYVIFSIVSVFAAALIIRNFKERVGII